MRINVGMIKSSFALVKPLSNQFATRFYEILLEKYPDAQSNYILRDVDKKKKMLLYIVNSVVCYLDKPDLLADFLLKLGDRYGNRAIAAKGYDCVGICFLLALSQTLEGNWNKELEASWAASYQLVVEAMIAGAVRSKKKSHFETSPQRNKVAKGDQQKGSTATSLKLSEEVKKQIFNSVEGVVQKLIQEEVQRCFTEQMRKIKSMSPEDLLKKVS